MRTVLQRVRWARVTVETRVVAQIDKGFLILLGVAQGDTVLDAEALATKISGLRIFSDADDKMNLALCDVGGACLVVSQFTLLADCSKGRRPHFGRAQSPPLASALCDQFVGALKKAGVVDVPTGIFGADMQVELCNDGPVTIVLDSGDLAKKG